MIMESFVNNVLSLMSYHLFLRRGPFMFQDNGLNSEEMFQISINGKDAIATYEAVVMGNIL